MTHLTNGNATIFVQDGGASPNNKPKTAGIEGQMMAIDGITLAQGDVAPIFARDPRRYKAFIPVATAVSPPSDFDSFDVMFRQDVGAIPKMLMRPTCPQTFYKNHGTCADPTDFLRGWDSYVLIIPDTIASGDVSTAGSSFEGDDANEDSQSRKARRPIFPIGALVFGQDEQAARAIISLTYGRRSTECITCVGQPETNDIYALVTNDGVAAAAVRYSTDGGQSWANLAITGVGVTEAPIKILATPTQLIVVTATAGGATLSGYYVSAINQQTGVPSATWVKVTTGFVATGVVADAVLTYDNTLFLGGALGYIYKAEGDALLSGVSVSRQGATGGVAIDHLGAAPSESVIAATLTTGDVLITRNKGVIWAFTTAAIPGGAANCVGVVNDKVLFVDNGAGAVYFTLNSGATWEALALTITGGLFDIAVVNQNVIYLAGVNDTLYSSWDGGRSWATTDPRLLNLPVFQIMNALAVPFRGNDGVRANHLLVGGLNTAGSPKGLIAVGAGNVK